MKKCPYCAEDIQDGAIYCRYCQHYLTSEKQSQEHRARKPTSNKVPKTYTNLAVIFLILIAAGLGGLAYNKFLTAKTVSSVQPTMIPSSFPRSSASSYDAVSQPISTLSSSGERIVSLYHAGVEILCGRTEQDYKALIDTLVDNDDYGFKEMFLTDRAFIVDSGTTALVLDIKFTTARVRILEGDHKNEIAWVGIESIRE